MHICARVCVSLRVFSSGMEILMLSSLFEIGTEEPIKCPIGTFRGKTLGAKLYDCHNCTNGSYCLLPGLTEPSGNCSEGFYCPLGSISPTEIICPPGFFCLHGTGQPSKCTIGTASNMTGLKDDQECPKCPRGFYCATPGQTNVTGLCARGYFCPTGSVSDKELKCPSAMHCPLGSPEPYLCADGTYTSWERAEKCVICPEGFYCVQENVTRGMYLFYRVICSSTTC